MNPPKQYITKLADKKILNDKFIQYYFELSEPNRMVFDAGQYVSIPVDAKGSRRSYSICSSPSKEHGFELLVDLAPNGLGVNFLGSLEFGQEMKMLGPLGMFYVSPQITQEPLVFIATGSGIAPFRGMVLNLLQDKKTTQPITLYWGMRYVEQLFWQDEFEELAENYPNFQFHPVISRASDAWPLCRGRVTDCLLVHDLPEQAHYYLCGSAGMIEDVMTTLQKRGVAKELFHHEKFY